jgi:hypothetical protein
MTMQMLRLRGFGVLTAKDAVDAVTTCPVSTVLARHDAATTG